MMKTQEEELEMMKASLDKIMREYKNEKFESSALTEIYNQALKII